MTRRTLAVLLLTCLPVAATAQDEGSSLDRIEVTGSRITYRDLLDTPAVAITRRGDYLLQELRLVNDSRDAQTRRNELHQTIAALLATSRGRFDVLHGDAYRVELDHRNHEVEVAEDEERPDTSHVTVSLRAKLGDDASQADAAIRALRGFATSVEPAGRTESELVGETALGMNRPERYRYELIDAIARDAERVTEAMKLDCHIALEGLNSRLEWQRVSAAELLLYIPYTMSISKCAARVAP